MAKPKAKKKKSKSETKAVQPVGRPSSFNEVIFTKIIEMAQEGRTDVEIADFIGVHPNTIGYWKRTNQEFLFALKEAKNIADQLVEASLFRRATGYSHQAVKHFLDKQVVENEFTGQREVRAVVIEKEYTEHYPPDTMAIMYWLNNRQPDKWRNPRSEAPAEAPSEDDKPKDIVLEWPDEVE